MIRKLITLLLVFVLVGLCAQAAFAGPANHKDRVLTVMTRNLDAGSDFWYVINAASNPNVTPTELLIAVTQTFQEMHASNIPQRADGIAAEIQATQPDLIGLQEVTKLRMGPFGQPAETVVDDGLQSLLTAMAQRGLHYAPIFVQQNADVTLPALDQTFSPIMVRLTDYDVVLARTDLPVSEFKLENIQADHFEATLPFPAAGQTIDFLRGWIAVDAKLRGKSYRFVTTHLETFNGYFQGAQADELLAGPLNSELPVILAGDLNSDAIVQSQNDPAYGILVSADFLDVWSVLHPNDLGITWPMHLEDIGAAPPSNPQRIDLVLIRGGGIEPLAITRTGTAPISGLWSSDHAGVVASFKLLP